MRGLSASSFMREDIMKLREYNQGDLALVQEAIVKLRQARDLLKKAGVRRTVDKVRRVLNSAEGAERHTARLKFRAENPRLCGGSGG